MAFKIGDMVKRTSGSWRGVNEGSINKVTSVWCGGIQLEGYADITFDGDNFALYRRPRCSTPRVEFERGQIIIYKYHDGNTYTGKVQDISAHASGTMLGVIRGGDGTYDAVNISDVLSLEIPLPTARFKVGDRVRLVNDDPQYGKSEVRVGDIGRITAVGGPDSEYDQDDLVIEFDKDDDWLGHIDDIEHVDPQPAPLIIMNKPAVPDISVDEAVDKYQTLRKKIADLQIELKTFEQVMLRHNLKPI
ncbi:hypothetical protein vB_PsyM_KIL3b_0138 [Pseudomonas phage vB_PsyM_KIL3b]|uniref:Uncharacterized protein n=3 Tax=Pseudomonas phage vB_PsyM_KIL1 TaxID=1777065 RepID=A0A142IG48_9CAUD|nr:hypothetical protein BH774_gp065 [Pseudomonas phage vB_PsyM_KIL1]AMR57384.1 hypothetical protein vB_PsyM_KIL1_0137 [Pseudomonas phage vB_PsyM_KIL1]AMR57705.1 hypothetical protein vB_PsyM_KIL3_0138 [Pseudomonas phage vB_PsyM_KIL3]AMR58203.1 hypothetical protein vB_PsyM_KIL3b_0138 [Pseudomonas phage vB_PsyM_KIL3b]